MERFGEVLVKEPPCWCFNVKNSAESEEEALSIRICADESDLQLASTCCCVWMEDECMDAGKGPMNFTYNFQTSLRTTALAIRVLKVVPYRDQQEDNVDCNFVCRVYLSLKDFRMLQTFNNSFMGRVQSLLVDVENRREFTDQREVIKTKLEEYSLAVFPDEEGFLLFKHHHEYTRPVHVLLRIDPPLMVMEICFPRSHLLLSRLSHERIPVTSLREAISEFSRSPSGWPVVGREEHRGQWSSLHHPGRPAVELSEEHLTWNSDESTAAKHTEPFLNDTVRELHKPFRMKSQDRFGDDIVKYEEESVRSLVRQVVQLRWQEHFSFYLTIEKATLAILGRFASTASVFVESVSRVIWRSGSESLCVYKLLLAAVVGIPAVKREVLRKNLLCLLLRQYEFMTQRIFSSTSSGSYNSHSTVSETQMEIGEMQYFTCPQLGEQGTTLHLSGSPIRRPSTDSPWTQTGQTPTSSHQVFHDDVMAGSEGTVSTLSIDLFDAPQSSGDVSNVARSSSLPDNREQRQNVPRLSFYWLIKHEGTRSSTNTGTTRTTISLPDGRSIVFGDERGGTDSLTLPLRGSQPAQHFTLTQGNEGCGRFLNSNIRSNSITRTLVSWGMKLEHIGENAPAHSVAYSIKCTLLEIFCAFSPLNLNNEVFSGLEKTKDYQLLFGNSRSPDDDHIDTLDEEDIQNPPMLAVIELLAPPWQVFPGEQPPIRWGPTQKGTQLALAVLHEFACRPLQEVDTSIVGLSNIRLFSPQDLSGEAYHSLIAGVTGRISQIAGSSRIIIPYIEETTSLINLLCDFVGSSPSSSQTHLIACSCPNAFASLESAVFCSVKVSSWQLPHFRAFHALLRLYRCMLERVTDVVLIEFLVSKLLEQLPWIKVVRDYTRAVMFSEKLDKKCDPEELACLRIGAWSYHTALVKVMVQKYQDENSRDTGYLPEDFRDSKPTAFGQDPLDFLSFLFAPESGLAYQVLKKKDWAVAQSGPPLGGGIHAQVLLFLKILFSIPNNGFMKQHEISAFYLNLHWTNFRRMYVDLNARRDERKAIVCRLHLEVLRVILKHHTLDIFAVTRKLGIIACLAREIGLEAAMANPFSNFDPPVSQLTMAVLEAEALEKPQENAQEKSSETEALDSSGQYSFLSSSAPFYEPSKVFNSVQDQLLPSARPGTSLDINRTSETAPPEDPHSDIDWSKTARRSSKKKKASSRSSSGSVRKVISKTFSFKSSPKKNRGGASPSGEGEGHRPFGSSSLVTVDDEPLSSRSIKKKSQRGKPSRGSRSAMHRNAPSRIPKLGSRRSPRKHNGPAPYRDRMKLQTSTDPNWLSSDASGDNSRNGSPSSSTRKSFVSPAIAAPLSVTNSCSFQSSNVLRKFSSTKIPRLPSRETGSVIRKRSSKTSLQDENEETKKGNSFQAITNYLHKKTRTFSGGGFSLFDKGQFSKNPSSKESQKPKKNATSTGREPGTAKSASRGFSKKKKITSEPDLGVFTSSKSKKGSSNIGSRSLNKTTGKELVIDNQTTRTINRTAKPVDGPSRLKIPCSPDHTRLNFSSSSSLTGRDSPLSYETSVASDRPRSRLKSLNVPLLNLSGIKDPSKDTKTTVIGQTKINISSAGPSSRSKAHGKKEQVNRLSEGERQVSRESSSRTQKGKSTVSEGRSSKSYSESRGTHRTDEYSDGNGPPTFGAYCGARAQEIDMPLLGQEALRHDLALLQSKKPPSVPKSSQDRTTKTISSLESQSFRQRFETPSDFECTGNVDEDCKKVELMLERAYYGLSSATFSSESPRVESSLEKEPFSSRPETSCTGNRGQSWRPNSSAGRSKSPQRRTLLPSSVMDSRTLDKKDNGLNSEGSSRVSQAQSRTTFLESLQSGCFRQTEDTEMTTAFSSDLATHNTSETGRQQDRFSPSTSGFKTPLELERFDNLEENSSTFFGEVEERPLLTHSPSFSSSGSDSFDSVSDTGDDLMTTVIGNARIVPKLRIPVSSLRDGGDLSTVPSRIPNLLLGKTKMENGNEESIFSSQEPVLTVPPKVPTLNLKTAPINVGDFTLVQAVDKTPTSKTTQSPSEEMSSLSWLHVSTKDSICDSEFAQLLNDGTRGCPTGRKKDVSLADLLQEDNLGSYQHQNLEDDISLCPCEALRRDRFVYSDLPLRIVFVEVLFEGMLLEYNTRAARDHDRCYEDVENITKHVPRILKHHLNHNISEPLIKSLNERLLFQSKNLHRLLRLFCHSFFPVDLYKSVDHLGRGAFSHVHRCDLPFTDAPETCAIKIMDHPIGHNEMSSFMDVYSEIYILEQFKDDPNVCSLYDYGVNKDSVFMVMKDYKCSLLEWRKKIPEQCGGALKLFLRIFQDIVNAVKKLHDSNVVHFDLKCSNVLLEPFPGISEEHFWNPPTEEPPFRVVLADFGEARSYNNNWEAKTVRNRGTEYNKSPEMLLIAKAQQNDRPEYDRRKRLGAGPPSDVWALGCLLFELVTGQCLQFDAEWSRFFLRVTTNTMNVVDNEKQKMLPTRSRTVIGDLLDYILVRTHLWRPNLNMLSRKLDTVMTSGRLGPYTLPRRMRPCSPVTKRPMERVSGIDWLGNVQFPTDKAIAFSKSVQIASIDCLLNPWFLSDKGITLIVCVKSHHHRELDSILRLRSTASRASVELVEICLEEHRIIEQDHLDIIVKKLLTRKACFTCERGHESNTMELVLGTIKQRESLGGLEALLEVWRQIKV